MSSEVAQPQRSWLADEVTENSSPFGQVADRVDDALIDSLHNELVKHSVGANDT